MLDRNDISDSTLAAQRGEQNRFFGITLPMSQNGKLIALKQEIEVPIIPCDSLWLPATFDPQFGQTQGQTDSSYNGPIKQYSPITDVSNPGFPNLGVNLFDAQSLTIEAVGDVNYTQYAPIFGLKFNTPNNPYTVWSLGNSQLTQPWGGTDGPLYRYGPSTFLRAINGPISRLWFKLYRYGYYLQTAPATYSARDASFIFLYASLGFSMTVQSSDNSIINPASYAVGQPPVSRNDMFGFGGYATPQMNSGEREALEDLRKRGRR